MSEESRSCPSCGARLPTGADTCDLCGTRVESTEAQDDDAADPVDAETSGTDEELSSSDAPTGATSNEEGFSDEVVYCNACGWENPAGANYCSQCGAELQDLLSEEVPDGARPVTADLPTGASPSEPEAPEEGGTEDEEVALGRQISIVVGTALALVLAFFFVTQWSQQYEWGEEDGTDASSAEQQAPAGGGTAGAPSSGRAGGPSGMTADPDDAPAPGEGDLEALVDELGDPVEGERADAADSLRTLAEQASGEERRRLQGELVALYLDAEVLGRAALVQSRMAEDGDIAAQRRAADLLYRWMRAVEADGDRAQVSEVAGHVAQAYAAVAEQRPEDLDARTRMGEAYLLTNSPMQGINEINAVLDDDSTFVPARFQKGLALLQINRLNEAARQFERVLEYASEDDPFYRQAERAIEVINEQGASSQGEAPSRSGS